MLACSWGPSVWVYLVSTTGQAVGENSLTVTLGYSDTFPSSRGCHCKRGNLYMIQHLITSREAQQVK